MDNTYKMFCRNRRNGRQRVPYIGTRPIVAARSPSDRHGHPSALGFAHGAGLGNVQGSSSSSSFGARMMGVGDLPRYRPSPTHAHGDEEGDEEDDDMELGSQQSGSLGASPLKSLEADEEDEEAFGVGEGRMSRVDASVPVPPVALSSSSQPQPIGKGQGLGQGQGPPRVTKDSSPTKKTTVIAAATSVDSLEREGLKKTSFWETPTGKATGSGTSFSPSVLLPSFPLSPSFPPSPSSLSPFPPSSDWSIIHTYCPSLLCLVHLYYSY